MADFARICRLRERTKGCGVIPGQVSSRPAGVCDSTREVGAGGPAGPGLSGAVMVTFRPGSEVCGHIRALAAQAGRVVVIDNSDRRHSVCLACADNVQLVAYAANRGLAVALNDGVDRLFAAGCDRVFLFDQDSLVPADFVAKMCEFQARREHRDGLHLYAPDFVDINAGTHARFARLGKLTYQSVECASAAGGELETNFAITSGTLLTPAVWQQVGRFRDDYFIDHIDTEYCLRAACMGIGVRINCAAVLRHAIGRRSVHRVLGLTIKPNHHSALRRYYMTRNGLRTMLDYASRRPAFVWLMAARLVHECLAVMLFESGRRTKLRAMGRGTLDALAGRMGAGWRRAA